MTTVSIDRPSLSALVDFTKNRVALTEREITRAVKAVCGHMEYRTCEFFNENIPTEALLETHINDHPKLMMITDDVGLSGDVYGGVLKKHIFYGDGESTYAYLVLVSPLITDTMERVFTISHELGHIYLHGRLLDDDMLTARRYKFWHQPTNRLRPLMEVEANIFALYSVIPKTVLIATYNALSHEMRREFVFYVQHVLQRIYGTSVDACMVVGRLYLHSISAASPKFLYGEKGKLVICDRGAFWIREGLSSMTVPCESDDKPDPTINADTIDTIMTVLEADGVLPT